MRVPEMALNPRTNVSDQLQDLLVLVFGDEVVSDWALINSKQRCLDFSK